MLGSVSMLPHQLPPTTHPRLPRLPISSSQTSVHKNHRGADHNVTRMCDFLKPGVGSRSSNFQYAFCDSEADVQGPP